MNRLIGVLAGAAALAFGHPAAAVTIDFDDAPAGDPTILTTQYAGLGVTFGSVQVYDLTYSGDVTPASGANYAHFETPSVIRFVDPGNAQIGATTSNVSFTNLSLSGYGGYYSGFTISAYDLDHNLLGAQTIAPVASGQSRAAFTTSFGQSGIATLEITDHTGAGLAPFDNLSFDNVVPVPEPGEWAMMIGGLSVVAGVVRRRRG